MKSKTTISILLKIGIVAFAFFFLYEKLILESERNDFNFYAIINNLKNSYFLVIVVFFMMFLNWSLEAFKWMFLVSKIEDISFLRSIRAIFSGITVSAFTPNRIGEYGGRVFCLEKADRIQAVFITIIGSMSQLLTTILFGSIGLLFLPELMPDFLASFSSINFTYTVFFILLLILNLLLIIFFLNTPLLSSILSRVNFLNKYNKYTEVFSYYSTLELVKVVLLSFSRYIVFTTQFFILLNVFDVAIAYNDAIILIATMLLAISVIPNVFPVLEVVNRSYVAALLFGLLSTNISGVVSATFVLWVINLLLPAIIGSIFIFTLKFFRK